MSGSAARKAGKVSRTAKAFGVESMAVEAGDDPELAAMVRRSAAAFMRKLGGKDADGVAAFWDERAIARGEKKAPKKALREDAADGSGGDDDEGEESSRRVKPGQRQRRAAALAERRAEAKAAAKAAKAGKKKVAAPLKTKKGPFNSNDDLWED